MGREEGDEERQRASEGGEERGKERKEVGETGREGSRLIKFTNY